MKKGNLLASTALVSAALAMGAGPAQALSLKLGGFAEFWAGYADNDKAAGVNNNFDLKTDAEIYFLAEEKLDNGITVGLRFEMEAGNGNDNGSGPGNPTAHDGFDESFAYIKTKWGQINIGNNDVASAYVGSPSLVGPVGLFKSDASDWLPGSYGLNNNDVDLGMNDAQNLTYFTPRVAGFQAIVSYTPDDSDYDDSDFDQQATSGLHNMWSAALKFDRKFGNVGVGVGAGYTTTEATDGSGRADRGPDTAEGYTFAGNIEIGPVKFGAAYAFENTVTHDDEWLAIGVRYKINKMHTVSLGWSTADRRDGAIRDTDLFTAGWQATMGKGVSFSASVFRADADVPGTTNDRDGWGAVGGLVLRF